MYTFEVRVLIDAPPQRVWRALCDPAEVVQWDTGVAAAIDAPPDYPQPGQHVRWRQRAGPFRILHDRPQQVIAERTLRSLLATGPFRFDETYALEARTGGCRLTAALRIVVPIPAVGRLIEQFYLGPHMHDAVRASLDALKHHCESTGRPSARADARNPLRIAECGLRNPQFEIRNPKFFPSRDDSSQK